MNLSSSKSYLAALFAVFIWGVFPALIKGTLELTSVEQLLTLRFGCSVLLFIFILPRLIKKIAHIPLPPLMGFILVGIVVFYSQTYALKEVPASWYIAIFTFVPILFLAIYREPLNGLGKLGSLFAIIGMSIFFMSLDHAKAMNLWNILLIIISMLSWVAYSVAAKKLHAYLKDTELVALSSLVGFLASLILWYFQGFQGQSLSLSSLSLCVLAGVLLPAALVAYSYSLRLKPVFAMFSQYLEPIFGLIVAALLLGEYMHFLQYIAAVVVIVGTLLVGIGTRKKV